MSLAIENCAGYVHVISETGEAGRTSGFYDVDPPLPTSDTARALIQGIPLGFQEIVQPTVTLDDKRTLYVFGSAWSEMSLTGILLLGDRSTKGALMADMIDWFRANKVSELKAPVRLSLGTTGVDAYLIGLTMDSANPRVNTQMFSLKFLTAGTK